MNADEADLCDKIDIRKVGLTIFFVRQDTYVLKSKWDATINRSKSFIAIILTGHDEQGHYD